MDFPRDKNPISRSIDSGKSTDPREQRSFRNVTSPTSTSIWYCSDRGCRPPTTAVKFQLAEQLQCIKVSVSASFESFQVLVDLLIGSRCQLMSAFSRCGFVRSGISSQQEERKQPGSRIRGVAIAKSAVSASSDAPNPSLFLVSQKTTHPVPTFRSSAGKGVESERLGGL